MHGLMVNYEKNPLCEDSNGKLQLLYEEAKKTAVRLIDEYQSYVDGEEELDSAYEYTFNSQLIEEREKQDEV